MEVVECKRCGRSRPVQPGTALGESCPYCLLMFMFDDDDEPSETGDDVPQTMPERLGPYRFLEQLGAGGMGTVYRARHEALDRTVALKVLRPEFAKRAGFRERFQHEARILASLTHQHIVGLHDTGCDDGYYYLAMELIAGRTIRNRMGDGERFTVDEAVRRLGELCDALGYAHQRGVVHRDIKPENILVDSEDRAKLTDFGIAKLLGNEESSRTHLTEVDAVVGTRRYMAPEQLEPGRTVDHRADLYTLAAVTYEMITGEAPLGAFGPPSAKVPQAAPLDGPLLGALAKEPKDRPADAAEFRRSVEQAWNGRKRMRDRRSLLAGAVAASGMALAFAWSRGWIFGPVDGVAKLGAVRLTHPAGVWRSVFLGDGATLVSACGDRHLRLWPSTGGDSQTLFTAYPRGELGYLALAASPDGASLTTAGGENVARVWNLATRGERFTLSGHGREIVDVAWSPDETLIATAAHDKSVRLWNAIDGKSMATLDGLHDPALCVAFSPDGKLLAAGIMNGAIKVWDVATRTLRGTLGHQKRVGSLSFGSGEVTRLVSGSHDRTLKIWTFEPDGAVKPKPTAKEIAAEGEVWSVVVSPRGDLIAAGLNDGTPGLWSFPEGKPIGTFKHHTESVVDVAFSADGLKLATSSLDKSTIVWDVGRLT